MATENRGVMVYLPPEVEGYITNFCTEYNITRKDKEGNTLPSLGTGVVTYLKSKILGESPDDILTRPSKVLSNGLSKEEVLDLINEYFTSHSPSTGLSKDEVLRVVEERISTLSVPPVSDGEVLTPLTQSIDSLRETLNELETYMMGNFEGLRESVKKLEESRLNAVPLQNSKSIASNTEKTRSPKPTASTSMTDGALTIAELTEKLEKTRQAIESRRNAGTLAEWGYRAEQVGRSWYYLPIESE